MRLQSCSWKALVFLFVVCSPVSGQCSSGWTLWADDGSEGHSSCLQLFTTSLTPLAAQAACAGLGGHLLTVQTNKRNTGIMGLAQSLSPSNSFTLGCWQSYYASGRGYGWAWVDGTNASNINCEPLRPCPCRISCACMYLLIGDSGSGYSGCGLWSTNQPDDNQGSTGSEQ